VLEHGGHFVAMEFPDLMAREIREFFRPLCATRREAIPKGNLRNP
jgi:hypothetical protein